MDSQSLNALSSAIFVSRCTLAGEAVDTDDKRIRASGLYQDCQEGEHSRGDIYNADGQTWECYQAYDNAVYPDIRPGEPAWYTFNRPLHGTSPETARPFVPVQGAHDMYRTGKYMVWTDGTIYRSKIEVGEAVWLSGHIGIYIGNGLAVECTPSWQNKAKVQVTACNCAKSGYNRRDWTKHGKIPYIAYVEATENAAGGETVSATPADKSKEDINMKIYKLLADVPSSYKDAVQKVVDKGALCGTGNGELNVSEDLCRMLTILNRLGKLD